MPCWAAIGMTVLKADGNTFGPLSRHASCSHQSIKRTWMLEVNLFGMLGERLIFF